MHYARPVAAEKWQNVRESPYVFATKLSQLPKGVARGARAFSQRTFGAGVLQMTSRNQRHLQAGLITTMVPDAEQEAVANLGGQTKKVMHGHYYAKDLETNSVGTRAIAAASFESNVGNILAAYEPIDTTTSMGAGNMERTPAMKKIR